MKTVAQCVPEVHNVKLDNPEVFILIEIFKVSYQSSCGESASLTATHFQSVCGMSIVKDYYTKYKFNVKEIVNSKAEELKFKEGEGRLAEKESH